MKLLLQTTLIPFVLVPLLIVEPVWAQTPVSPASDEAAGGSNLQLRIVSADDSRIPAGLRSVKGFTIQVTNANGAGVPEAAVAFRLPDSGSSGAFSDGSHSAVAYTDNTGNAHVNGIQWNSVPGTAIIRITASKGDDHAGLLVEQTLVLPGDSSLTAGAQPVHSAPPLPPPAPVAAERSAPRIAAAVTKPESFSVSSIGRIDRSLSANPLKAETEPSISIVSSPQEKLSSGGSKKKWIILGLVIAAGAGAGFAFASKSGKSSSTAATSSSISFGSPTVSVGNP